MRNRQGFTLVELLVSMALIVFVMVIMTEAFTAGLGSFRQLKAIGDMQEKLRSVSIILRNDLAAYHFDGNYMLSTDGFFSRSTTKEGFFYIRSPALSSFQDQDQVSYDVANATAVLHFTIQQEYNGQALSNYYFGNAPNSPDPIATSWSGWPDYQTNPATLNSQWAEVAYFLLPNGASTPLDSNNQSLPLFTLYRRQAVIMSAANVASASNTYAYQTYIQDNADQLYEVSYKPEPTPGPTTKITFNSPSDVQATPQSRMLLEPLGGLRGSPSNLGSTNPLPASANSAHAGDDILLTNVLSFTVRVLPLSATAQPSTGVHFPSSPNFVDLSSALLGLTATGGLYEYDTSAGGSVTQIGGIQITIQIWDIKTEQTRQITVIQSL